MASLPLRIYIYNLIMTVFAVATLPWTVFQLIFVPRRRIGLAQRLGKAPKSGDGPIWIHAVSVGEVRAVAPMIGFLSKRPGIRAGVFLSTVTATGQATAVRECPAADEVFYFPLDLAFAASKALKRVRPAVFVTAETEIWPNFLNSCFRMGIPVVVVNGRISDRSYARYRRFSWFFAPILKNIDCFLMQSLEDADRITAMGAPAERVICTGNTKYDRKPLPQALPDAVRSWVGDRLLLTGGSTHSGEEELMLDMLAPGGSGVGLILALAPRHPERFNDVAALLEERKLAYTRFTRVVAGDPIEGDVILVDAMGVLEGFYSISGAAFVGGSLVPVGGHNILEPAAFGVPVLTGPYMENFRDMSREMVEAGGCIVVQDAEQLKSSITRLINDKEYCQSLGAAAKAAREGREGASERNASKILSLMGTGC